MRLPLLAAAFCVTLASGAIAQGGGFRAACNTRVLCAGVQPGGGRLIACLREHRAQLSVPCKLALADLFLNRAGQKGGGGGAGAGAPGDSRGGGGGQRAMQRPGGPDGGPDGAAPNGGGPDGGPDGGPGAGPEGPGPEGPGPGGPDQGPPPGQR